MLPVLLYSLLALLTVAVAVRVAARIVSFVPSESWRGEEVRFRNLGGVHMPLQPWPARFFVARHLRDHGLYEVRPLTVWNLLHHLVTSEATWTCYAALFLLREVGLIEVEDNSLLPRSPRGLVTAWRWAFWRTPTRARWWRQATPRRKLRWQLRARRVRAWLASRFHPGARGGAA